MVSLYSLALMLAGDPEKAEQLFVSGLEDSSANSPVFKEWARSWARRTIIKNAVRMITPGTGAGAKAARKDSAIPALPGLPAEMYAVLSLSAFERFAFILSVLEGYSDQDSALLLGSTRQAFIAARVRAEQRIARALAVRDGRPPDINPKNQESVLELAAPAQLAIPA
jgi:DNA-directed RNA polymerase specialized sigma24 family protein